MLKSNFSRLIETQRRRARQIPQGFERAGKKAANDALKVARDASSQRAYNPRTFKGKVPPFSRRAAATRYPPHLINRQSGRFEAGWKAAARRGGKGVTWSLENATKPAAFFKGGTRHMIPRPVLEYVAGQVKGKPLKYSREELHKALKGT